MQLLPFLVVLAQLHAAPQAPAARELTRPGGPPESTVVRADEAVRRLSERMKQPVAISGELRQFPVFVDDAGQDAQTVLNRLATALQADLVPTDRGVRLERTPQTRKRLQEIDVATVRQRLADEMGRVDKDVRTYAPLGSISSQVVHVLHLEAVIAQRYQRNDPSVRPLQVPIDGLTPAGRLLRELLERIGLARLASVPPEGIRFFSNEPVGIELPIGNCDRALKRFIANQNDYLKGPLSEPFIQDARILQDPWVTNQTRLGPDDHLKVVITESRSYQRISLKLGIYSSTGSAVAFAAFDTGHAIGVLPFEAQIEPILSDPGAHWIDLSPPTRAYLTDFANIRPKPLPEDSADTWTAEQYRTVWPDTVLHPEQVEPDTFLIPEYLREMRRHSPNKIFIAVLPDSIWDAAVNTIRDGRGCVEGFAKLLKTAARCETRNGADATLLRAEDPLEAEAYALDRVRVGDAVRQICDARRITLTNWSHYCAVSPNSDSNALARFYDAKLLYTGIRRVRGMFAAPRALWRAIGLLQESGRLTSSRAERLSFPDANDMEPLTTLFTRHGGLKPKNLPELMANLPEFFGSETPQATLAVSTDTQPAFCIYRGNALITPPFGTTAEMVVSFFLFDPILRSSRRRFDAEITRVLGGSDVRYARCDHQVIHVTVSLPHRVQLNYKFLGTEAPEPTTHPFAEVPRGFWDDAFQSANRRKIETIPSSENGNPTPP